MQDSLSSYGLGAVWLLAAMVLLYFGLLYGLAHRSLKGLKSSAGNAHFFSAGKAAPWPMVAFGMIGASLSGVTFVSIPGQVGAGGLNQGFSYFQVALGYFVGYAVIATVLLPLFYRLGLTSIYEYLGQRFGQTGQRVGTLFFMASRSIGASFRLYLSTLVLHTYIFGPLGLPFMLTAALSLGLIWVYTRQGGLQTIIQTDVLQTFFMLLVLVLGLTYLYQNLSPQLELWPSLSKQGLNQVFFWQDGWSNPNHFLKQFLSGVFICLAMTGLDQDMMQKNLSCENLGSAQKNMWSFSLVLLLVNFCFLLLGALLWLYAQNILSSEALAGFQKQSDMLFPHLAFHHFPALIGICFVLGLIAATYSSADSSMTALTTSFCIDLLGLKEQGTREENIRRRVHLGFALWFFVLLLCFYYFMEQSVLNSLFQLAGYTYGPLLALFGFGLLFAQDFKPQASHLFPLTLGAMALSHWIKIQAPSWGYTFGFELLLLNAGLCFLGLCLSALYLKRQEHGKKLV